jgi:hypothetical protein
MDGKGGVSMGWERSARELKQASIALLIAGLLPVLSFLVYVGLLVLGRIGLYFVAPTGWLTCVLLLVLSRDVLRGENLGLAIGVVAFYGLGAAAVTIFLGWSCQSPLALVPGVQLLLFLTASWLLIRARRRCGPRGACGKTQTR